MYKYFKESDYENEEILNKVWKDLQKKFHPDLHQNENSGIDYNKITGEINSEYQELIKLLETRKRFSQGNIFSTIYNEVNKIRPEFREEADIWAKDYFFNLIKKVGFSENQINSMRNELKNTNIPDTLVRFLVKISKK